ncbi:MAG TPA: DNA polymerase III subunit delta' [Pyrinomonadaceae bacterium]|nr:DNA polymerase III subunit delta' [Pyrinomonadaceae bacterium]
MFSTLIGNDEVKALLRHLLASGRMPGSLLFTGEEGIGKKLFALELAKSFNCRNRQAAESCDECSSCKRISRSTFPPFGKDDDDKDRLIWSEHADVAMARPYKNIIRVPVMRELEREANFRPFEGAARVFIVEDAEYMNDTSANALLKTLEEPAPTSHLILTTSNPTALLATIRSRCQTIRFAPIPVEEIEKFLIEERRLPTDDAQLLARTSSGSLGRALSTDIETYRARRDSMLDVLTALTLSGDRAQLLRSAEALAAAKDRDEYEQRLDALETLIRDAWALALGQSKETIVNGDLFNQLQPIAAEIKSEQAAKWLIEIEDVRAALEVNINRRVASDALFLTMATS